MGYEVKLQSYSIPAKKAYKSAAGKTAVNVEVRKPGTDPQAPCLILGAHYDTRVGMEKWNVHGPVIEGKTGTPGANDNASGVAALLRLARTLKDVPTKNGIIFVAYANEEAPFFQTDEMGSRVHARRLVEELGTPERVLGMMSLETLGVYSPRVNKKRRSAVAGSLVGLHDRCDYVAFMSTNRFMRLHGGRSFSRKCAEVFASGSRFPVRALAFSYLTRGIAWSDDWSYMKEGIPSFAITDTAYMRCDDYHETSDTPEKLDCREFAEVVIGIDAMLRKLCNNSES
jgi:Zn-dependent M28 family amino/carboxypeptidase